MVLLVLIVLSTAYVIFVYRRQLVQLWKLNRHCRAALVNVPGPPCLPIIGAAHQFKWNNVEFAHQLEQFARQYIINNNSYYGLAKIWIGPVPIVFCGTQESIRPILESTTNISKPSQYDIISEWIGIGLLTSTNEKWLRRRKMLTSAFHFTILQEFHDIFVQQGEIFVDLIAKEEGFFDLFPYIKRCSLDIICETAMGTAINCQIDGSSEYVQAVQRLTSILWKHQRFPWLWLKPVWYLSGFGFEFDRLIKLTNDFTREVIAKRKGIMEEGEMSEESAVSPNKKKLAFLDLLLHMQRSDELTDEDIREEVDTFMFEGHDTTSSGIAFTVWWLGQMPECQEKVHEELDSVFGDSNRLPTPEDLKKLVYLERCIKESLRLTPPVPLIARKLTKDVAIGDVVLPVGLTVVVWPMTTARDERYWERPEEFYPEHFDTEKVAKRSASKFALIEEKAVLSWIFRRYHVETEEPFPGNTPIPQLVLKPMNGIRVRLTKR
ncbi:hypothetical protein KIN20_024781 [Parelaphostrongylus tenuis]|uniref:Cytochrome P450 n=1 Tax=Parelaphostrongylus tenuis TaxID=148309 RepID=A0AAD5NA92_PARTN|nr:hypothetical protein KIN20_024781 [Parelaphostrongylus tenuis]